MHGMLQIPIYVHGMAKNKHPKDIKVIANDKLVVKLANEWLG